MSWRDPREEAVWWVEWGTTILLAVLVVLLHVSFLTHAGPLWRDEVNSVELATGGSWSSLYASLQFEPFPLLSFVFLRGWVSAGWGGSDGALRVFGFVVGIGFLGAVWLTARRLRCPAPLLSLALIGLSPVAIRATDSVRPHGPGIVLIVLTLGFLWKALEAPTAGRMVGAGVFGILSVQDLYQNASLLFGIYVAGMVAAVRDGRAKTAGGIGMLGAAAALSLVPYWSAITAAQSWNVVNQGPADIPRLLSVLMEALGSGGAVIGWVWIGVALFCCTAAIAVQFSARDRPQRRRPGCPHERAGAVWSNRGLTDETGRRLALFSVTAIMVATAAFLVTLKATGLPTQVWHYVPLMATVGPVVDATVWAVATSKAWRIGRLVLVLVIAGTAALPAWRGVQERRTNVDLVASLVGTQARAGDVIVVYPWYYGISFRRYYTGNAGWVTLPPLDDIRIHRYDLLKTTMTRSNPIDSVREAMAKTLKSGQRVWLVGGLPFLNRGERPPTLPPAPNGIWGWNNGPYLETWARQAAYFLQIHARGAEMVPITASGPVNLHENVPVVVVSGWR
jgi:hypothetical protein